MLIDDHSSIIMQTYKIQFDNQLHTEQSKQTKHTKNNRGSEMLLLSYCCFVTSIKIQLPKESFDIPYRKVVSEFCSINVMGNLAK